MIWAASEKRTYHDRSQPAGQLVDISPTAGSSQWKSDRVDSRSHDLMRWCLCGKRDEMRWKLLYEERKELSASVLENSVCLRKLAGGPSSLPRDFPFQPNLSSSPIHILSLSCGQSKSRPRFSLCVYDECAFPGAARSSALIWRAEEYSSARCVAARSLFSAMGQHQYHWCRRQFGIRQNLTIAGHY